MGYIIEYDPEKKTQYPTTTFKQRRNLYYVTAVMLIGTLLVLVVRFRSTVQDWLIPGNKAVTTAAFQALTEDVRDGKPAGEAITTFCKEIIDHAAE